MPRADTCPMALRPLRRVLMALACALLAALPGPARASLSDDTIAAFLRDLWPAARARGVAAETFEQAFTGFTPDDSVRVSTGTQPEFEKTIGAYVVERVTATRVDNGQRKARELARLLAEIETRYGVDRHVLLAIWGMETAYGASKGNRSIVRSLATLAMVDARRGPFWRRELISALVIAQEQRADPSTLTGSWAGAMGHTQFIPSTYARFAVDYDRDGRRDLANSVPDALASAANYLARSGWIAGLPWGVEVELPASFDASWSAPGRPRPLLEWLSAGVRPRVQSGTLALGTELQLMLPAGAGGPAFLVTSNFRTILRYNQSNAYALSVGLLADRIAGRPQLGTPWPAEAALSRADRADLQRLLAARGHRSADAEGVLGEKTRAAIRAFQRQHRLPEDGYPSAALLRTLRAAGGTYASNPDKRS